MGITAPARRSLRARVQAIVERLPDTAAVTLPISTLKEWLAQETDTRESEAKHHARGLGATDEAGAAAARHGFGWRTALWTCPDQTRLGVRELAEALDRSTDWVYRAISSKWAEERGRDPLPCRRLDGCLVFEAVAIRAWLAASEVIVNPEPRLPCRRRPTRAPSDRP
jgi:hypothetical protein